MAHAGEAAGPESVEGPGSVGSASRTGYEFITIYIGPVLMIGLFSPLLVRIVRLDERSTVLRRTADDNDPHERVIVANADQRDTNSDGYGNLCDADLDNDGRVWEKVEADLLVGLLRGHSASRSG